MVPVLKRNSNTTLHKSCPRTVGAYNSFCVAHSSCIDMLILIVWMAEEQSVHKHKRGPKIGGNFPRHKNARVLFSVCFPPHPACCCTRRSNFLCCDSSHCILMAIFHVCFAVLEVLCLHTLLEVRHRAGMRIELVHSRKHWSCSTNITTLKSSRLGEVTQLQGLRGHHRCKSRTTCMLLENTATSNTMHGHGRYCTVTVLLEASCQHVHHGRYSQVVIRAKRETYLPK